MFRNIIENAILTKAPLVKTAFEQERHFRQKTAEEIDALLVILKQTTAETTVAILQNEVLEKLALDTTLIERMNAVLASYAAETQVSYAVKTNKMILALQGAATFVQETDNLQSLMDGTVPRGFRFTTRPDEMTTLGENEETLYGSSKGTFLKTALFSAIQASARKNHLQDILPSIDSSAMTHVAPLPANAIDKHPEFTDCSYYFSDFTTPAGLSYVHSGYAFGGHRNEPRYPVGKPFGPEDCSSWIAKLCQMPTATVNAFSTLDQLYHYRLQWQQGSIPTGWRSAPIAATMQERFTVVRDPQKEIQPGQIYAHRNFKGDQDLLESGGSGGHTALVLGFEDNKIVTFGYNRDMPKEEGFGIQAFPFTVPQDKQVMLFKTKIA